MKTSTSSTGDIWLTQYKYPNDFNTQAPYNSMIGALHMVSPVVEQLEYKNNTGTFLSSKITNYAAFNGNANAVYPGSMATKKGAERYEPRVQFNGYDNFGNVTDVNEINGSHKSYQWGYNSEYPVAQVTNAAVNDIFYEGFEEGGYSGYYNDAKTGHHSYNSTSTPYSKRLPAWMQATIH